MAKLLECVWVKCTGEAHSNFNIDHCGICMPYWLWYPTCPWCGRKLKDTTPETWAMENRMSGHRLWCQTCKEHVLYVPEPTDEAKPKDAPEGLI
jgi:rRNA maturation protein Nop10